MNDPIQTLRSGKLTSIFFATLTGLSLVIVTTMPDAVHAAPTHRSQWA